VNQEIKERWLAALLSGEYKQTDGYLNVQAEKPDADNPTNNNGDGFCCLGVLCELAVADGVIQKQRNNQNDFFEYGDPERQDWDYSILPETVKEWAGLRDTNPFINDIPDGEDADGDFWVPISEPNDNGLSFAEIAKFIERDL